MPPTRTRRAAVMPPFRHARNRPRHAGPRRRSKRFWIWLAPTLLLVAAVAWVGARGWLAKTALEEAQALVSELKIEAGAMNLPGIEPIYGRIADRTAEARALTTDPIWRAAELVPVLGSNLEVVRVLAESTDEVMVAVEPLVDMASELGPASFAPQDGAIPLDPFVRAGPLVESASTAISGVNDRVLALDASGTIGPVANARDRFLSLIGDVLPPLDAAAQIVPMIPALLGAEGAQTYVVMFQNNAELRSLGGTALSFARITIDGGRIQLEESVPAGLDNFPAYPASPIPVPDGFEAIYPAAFGRFIANATLRPSFPSAAEITYRNWIDRRGVEADVVISIDAVALSYLLRATGPVTLSTGDTLDSTNATRFLLNEVLQRYQTGDVVRDNRLQDQVYGEAVSQTFAKLSSGAFDVPTMASAMLQAFSERRMAIWSADPDQQVRIAAVGMDNDLPESDATTDVLGLYVNDYVGSKLNFYLGSSLTTQSAVCSADGRQVHRLIAVFNNLIAPDQVAGLSPSITGAYARFGVPLAYQRLMLFGYAPEGSQFIGASIDGQPVQLEDLHDTTSPVAKLVIAPPPGVSSTVVLDVLMAQPGERELETIVTPQVNPTARSEAVLDCSTVALPSP